MDFFRDGGGFVFVVLMIAIFIAVAIIGAYMAAKRRKELQLWADSHGLMFDESHDYSFDSQYAQYDCFKQGDNRYAYNRLSGPWGNRQFLGFDYHYETHSTDSKGRRQTHHHHFSGVILSSECPLEPLFIRPESFFDKITEFFGWDDIDFESAEFSRKFYVKAQDKKWAYDVLHQRTMEFLLQSPKFNIQCSWNGILAWQNSTFSAAEFEAATKVLEGILDRLPEYLVRQQQESYHPGKGVS